jgi:hypothetical protein
MTKSAADDGRTHSSIKLETPFALSFNKTRSSNERFKKWIVLDSSSPSLLSSKSLTSFILSESLSMLVLELVGRG